MNISVVAFDADDTLWINEPYFRNIETQYCKLLSSFADAETISSELFVTEMANISTYGYGVKSFMLSMIETALSITDDSIDPHLLHTIIRLGKELLNKPIELLPGIIDLLETLNGSYKLVVATKGDLLDQERKLKRSGIEHYFHHIEIMSEKRTEDYRKLIAHLDIPPASFMMIGNSYKSDILPVLQLGGYGVYVPFHTTWQHETTEEAINHPHCFTPASLVEIKDILAIKTTEKKKSPKK